MPETATTISAASGRAGSPGTTAPRYDSTDTYSCSEMPRYRHAGNTVPNFVFCDGHAKAQRPADLTATHTVYDPYYNQTVNVMDRFTIEDD